MGGRGGRPVTGGAASVLWAVTLPDHGPTGTFTRDGHPPALVGRSTHPEPKHRPARDATSRRPTRDRGRPRSRIGVTMQLTSKC
jgi:hypothetical protein